MWTLTVASFLGILTLSGMRTPLVNCDPPTLEKTRRAANQLKSGKAPGGCCIYAEILRAGRAAALLWLHTLLCSIWNTGIISTDWRRGVVPI